jgi:two-component system NtrC family sensor kinase
MVMTLGASADVWAWVTLVSEPLRDSAITMLLLFFGLFTAFFLGRRFANSKDKKRGDEDIRRHNRELQAVNDIASLALQSFDRDEVVSGALAQAVDLFSADAAAICLRDQEKRTFRRTAAFGYSQKALSHWTEVEFPAPFLEAIERDGVEVITHADVALIPEKILSLKREEALITWVWAIMRVRDKVVGMLAVSWRSKHVVSATERSLAIAISRQLAISLDKIQLYEETNRAYQNLRQTQEQLLQSEKMAAIGQLVSGVAHEINNPLTAILGYAQLLESEKLDERSRDYVSKLRRQAHRTQRLVQNLLSFAHSRKPSKALVDPRQIVADTLALRDYDFRRNNIEVDCDFESGIPGVIADANQLEQSFLNIINNAVDALIETGHGGKLWVRIAHVDARVLIEFRDNGPGLADPHRVFDPFYTTKLPGKGTGLGLSICYGILKEHGGEILASNHPGGGACFQVYLPASQSVQEANLAAGELSPGLLQNCRILILDNEEALLETAREALTAVGAEVTAVSEPEQALRAIRHQQFDAIVVDCTLGGEWNAHQIYASIRLQSPGAEKNLILCGSDLGSPDLDRLAREKNIKVLTKPFTFSQLVRTLANHIEPSKAAISKS